MVAAGASLASRMRRSPPPRSRRSLSIIIRSPQQPLHHDRHDPCRRRRTTSTTVTCAAAGKNQEEASSSSSQSESSDSPPPPPTPTIATHDDLDVSEDVGHERLVMESERQHLHDADEATNVAWKQLLGVKDAPRTVVKWRLRLQLTKPITWFSLCTGVIAGCMASGNAFHADEGENLARALFVFVLAGPCMGGFTQTMNDWFDREVDAINEPDRPIPSGQIDGFEVMVQIGVLLVAGLLSAVALDAWNGLGHHDALFLALTGAAISTAYSVEPLRLKERNGWISGLALGISYIMLPWMCSMACFRGLDDVPLETLAVSFAFSVGALGISVVNDFKSSTGDRHLGLKSLPVMYGDKDAARISALVTDLPQLGVAAMLAQAGRRDAAIAIVCSVLLQVVLQQRLLLTTENPSDNDLKYMATSMPLFTGSLWVAASACGALF